VRAGVAALALGELIRDPERQAADCDPNYQRWMRRVERARQKLERQADGDGLVLFFPEFADAPPVYAAAMPRSLAAKTGGLIQDLEAADRAADRQVRHHIVPWPGGTLRLAAGEHGLMLLWEGGEAERPNVRRRGEDGKPHDVAWQPSLGDRLLFVTPLLPWVKGRVVLRVGKEKVTIRR
jgi:hypothetical protein